MMNRIGVGMMLLLVIVATTLRAGEYHVPRARLPFMKASPRIDGEVGDAEWAGAIRMERFCGVRSPLLTGGEASFWVGCDGRRIFVAVVSETAPGGALLQRVMPAPDGGDARTWLDDSIELVLDPLRADTTERRRLYHANFNARGAIYDMRHSPKGGGEAWRGRWEIASKVMGDRWQFEAALPLEDLGVKPADLRQPFGVRVCRNWPRSAGPKQSEWSSVGGAFLSTETMPEIIWDADAPVVQVAQLRDPGATTARIRVTVRNPHRKPVQARVHLLCRPKNSAPHEGTETLTVPAGELKTSELSCGLVADETAYTLIDVTSPDGTRIYYLRDFLLKFGRPDPFFIIASGEQAPFGLEFAYFPSYDTMKVRVDVSGLRDKAKVKAVRLGIRAAKGGGVLAETPMAEFRDGRAQMTWKIPRLGEGAYELVARLDGVRVAPVVRGFVRHVFPWEHNQIGKSDVVFPPFTPIRVADMKRDGTVSEAKVHTVLRTHTQNRIGLWDQVESLGTPLLKGPMRLEARAGGKMFGAEGKGFRLTDQGATRVVGTGDWSAGPFSGAFGFKWDYDGAMVWVLDVHAAREKMESLKLTIPLDNALCPLMHACTDGIRFNYAGSIPAGEGRVWDGRKAPRNAIVGSYVPYLWVGEEGRGLCVFGENDNGWITTPEAPCQEIVRRGDTLEFVLHLVSGPAQIGALRRITLAFQATPVKPMPPDWRLRVFGSYRGAAVPGITRYIAFLGSCWYWGTETPCLDYYPRGGDMTYLRKLAETRKTGVADTKFMEAWLAGFEKIYAAAEPAKRKHTEQIFRAHTNAAFHVMKGKPRYVCFYTNGRGVRFDTPEGQTFQDEWYREAFSKRKWGFLGGVAYDLDPVESFRDYALWYFKAMAEILVDSIYWDDLFLQSNFNTVGTAAYERPDGVIQPSMGLFNMREYVRRTALMYHEMGRPIQNIVHMTNTAITPVLSFAQMNYTWEDKSGAADFQDRFSRDYIRAESLGVQQGNVPFALWLVNGGDKAKLDWVARTGTGVMLVHEIKTSGSPAIFWVTFARMVEYGYGKPDVEVSQYWKKDHPAKVEGTDAATLVVHRPGSALVLVCDYGHGGNVSLVLDRAALGLKGKLSAVDLESGGALPVTANARVGFALRKHDFKLVLVKTVPEGEK